MTTSKEKNILNVEQLTLSWQNIVVVEDISLDLKRGEIACIVGRSGSGKTTIFDALAGFSLPDIGTITIDGKKAVGRTDLVGYVQQSDMLLPWMSVLDNVSLPLRAQGMKKHEARELASKEFASFGLEGAQSKLPFMLSGGMRQRAALLRTYLMKRDLLLCDEPFSALDALTRQDMQQWLLDVISEHRMSALVITHDIDEAIFLADKIFVLVGDPMQGTPSKIATIKKVSAPREERAQFILAPQAQELKKSILETL